MRSRRHSLEVRVLALQVLIPLLKLFVLRPHAEDLPSGNFCDAIDYGGVEIGATFPRFAVSAQNGILGTQF